MASERGRTDSPLVSILFGEPYRFEFFQAVRLLERINSDRRPVGLDVDPSAEVARFRTRVSLGFPPSAIHRISRNGRGNGNHPPEVEVAFMGLTGPLGVLPHPYTELLIERTRSRDTTLWSFLDLFNHRLISLFYRVWEKYHFAIAYELGREDRFTEYLFDIVGIGTRGLRKRLAVSDQSVIFYGGLVAQRPHSSSGLEAMLSDYFDVRARVQQFAGQWLKLDDDSVTRLGSANSELGVSAVAGSRVWDNQSKFRVKFESLTFDRFRSLLPVGDAFAAACDITRLMAGMEFDFDIQLTLKAAEVPGCILSTRGKRKYLLGWTTWLKTKPFEEDDSQVVLNPELTARAATPRDDLSSNLSIAAAGMQLG
jgi:type VI secretion system protein ImpH